MKSPGNFPPLTQSQFLGIKTAYLSSADVHGNPFGTHLRLTPPALPCPPAGKVRVSSSDPGSSRLADLMALLDAPQSSMVVLSIRVWVLVGILSVGEEFGMGLVALRANRRSSCLIFWASCPILRRYLTIFAWMVASDVIHEPSRIFLVFSPVIFSSYRTHNERV